MELITRIKILIRWQRNIQGGENFIWGPFLFDYSRREIVYKDRTINLTGIESDILRTLINNSPNVVTYSILSDVVWGDYYEGSINSLKVHVHYLRKKIEVDPNRPHIIMSKIGIGYYAVKPEI
jgi:DNA-binding response OmpR family regulator